MLRRDFIQISSLGVAGLLALRPASRATPAPQPIAIVYPDRLLWGYRDTSPHPDSVLGAVTMLRESGFPLDITDQIADFSKYKILILADNVLFSLAFKEKIETFLQQGGAVLASFKSGLTPDGGQFATAAFGLELVGEARYSPDFIDIQGSALGSGMASSELVMYLRGMEVAPNGATVLARTLAPLADAGSYPAATACGKVIYFMHPIFTQYHRTAPRWCRHLVLNAMDRLVPGITTSTTRNSPVDAT